MDFRKMCNVQVEILTFRKQPKALRDLSNVFRHPKKMCYVSLFILFESEKRLVATRLKERPDSTKAHQRLILPISIIGE